MTVTNCDFCGKKTEVKRTHYGTSFGYVRLICKDCAKELEKLFENARKNS